MNEEAEITCDHCKEVWPLSKILRHIAQSKKGCKKNYVSDRYDFLKEQVNEVSKAKKKKYHAEYYQQKREERKKSFSQTYEKNKEKRKQQFS